MPVHPTIEKTHGGHLVHPPEPDQEMAGDRPTELGASAVEARPLPETATQTAELKNAPVIDKTKTAFPQKTPLIAKTGDATEQPSPWLVPGVGTSF